MIYDVALKHIHELTASDFKDEILNGKFAENVLSSQKQKLSFKLFRKTT